MAPLGIAMTEAHVQIVKFVTGRKASVDIH